MKKVLMILTSIVIVLIISSRAYMNSHPIEPIPEYVEPKIEEKVVTAPISAPVQVKPNSIPVKTIPKPRKQFKCDGRKHCSQMRSYDEAKYFNDYCPNTKMDGDHDGIPCERQFRRW